MWHTWHTNKCVVNLPMFHVVQCRIGQNWTEAIMPNSYETCFSAVASESWGVCVHSSHFLSVFHVIFLLFWCKNNWVGSKNCWKMLLWASLFMVRFARNVVTNAVIGWHKLVTDVLRFQHIPITFYHILATLLSTNLNTSQQNTVPRIWQISLNMQNYTLKWAGYQKFPPTKTMRGSTQSSLHHHLMPLWQTRKHTWVLSYAPPNLLAILWGLEVVGLLAGVKA